MTAILVASVALLAFAQLFMLASLFMQERREQRQAEEKARHYGLFIHLVEERRSMRICRPRAGMTASLSRARRIQ